MLGAFRRLFPIFLIVLCMTCACGGDDDDSSDSNPVDDASIDDDDADDDSSPSDDDDGDDDTISVDDDANDDLDDDADDDFDDDLDDDFDDGPYPIGNKTVVLVDESRGDPSSGGPRTLVTEIWYPATDDSLDMPRDKLSNFYTPWEEEAHDFFVELDVPGDVVDAMFDYDLDSARDAPLREREQPYPLVIFSHGNGSVRYQNFTLFQHLAKNGFIVLTPSHTGNAFGAPLPDQFVKFEEDLTLMSYLYRPIDVVFLIDEFTGVIPNPEIAEFAQAVDPERIAAGGMSFGGYTATEAAKNEPRLKAAFSMAFPILPWGMAKYSTPSMFLWGNEDVTLNDYIHFIELGYVLASAPKYGLRFMSAGHFSFTDLCIFIPTLLGVGDGCGEGIRRNTGEPFTFTEPDRMAEITNNYVLAFVKSTLYHDEEASEYLTQNHYAGDIEYMYK